MTKPNTTEIVFVVDRSGSMSTIADDMKGGFDSFIAKQKELPGECKVTLVQFDDEPETVYTALSLNEVPALDLVPRGMTALLDAVGKAIQETGMRLAAMPEHERPSQVLFVIITDGRENQSKEYGRNRVYDMITHQREKYSWEFVFLGANQDAFAEGTSMGISPTNSVTTKASSVGTKALFHGLSANVATYRSSGLGRSEGLYDQSSYNSSMHSVDADPQAVVPAITVDPRPTL